MAENATSPPIQQSSLLQTVLIMIAVWGLVSMPVTYTGGASLPHPHSYLQFVREAETGTMSHHNLPKTESAPDHAGMGHANPRPKSDQTVENAPLISPPSFGIERLVLASAVQPALVVSLFVLFAAIWLAAVRLTGRVISPLIPPPRTAIVRNHRAEGRYSGKNDPAGVNERFQCWRRVYE
ncbi:MAG: hypothetical protein ACRDHN_00445 [Thermomicrobiales bacterium]